MYILRQPRLPPSLRKRGERGTGPPQKTRTRLLFIKDKLGASKKAVLEVPAAQAS